MKKNETGRSMVEMLGVLAIIGVLSVAGIAGYTAAMRKYRANEIAQAISTMSILARTANGGEGITENQTYVQLTGAAANPSGATTLTANGGEAGFANTIAVTVDDHDLCVTLQNIFGTVATNPIYVSTQCPANNGTTMTVTVRS
ncbi:MAG: Tfp pilus assembly protein FimT/FimU [Alphaproteobacteria bacterium]